LGIFKGQGIRITRDRVVDGLLFCIGFLEYLGIDPFLSNHPGDEIALMDFQCHFIMFSLFPGSAKALAWLSGLACFS
jgi:hypothetical protein